MSYSYKPVNEVSRLRASYGEISRWERAGVPEDLIYPEIIDLSAIELLGKVTTGAAFDSENTIRSIGEVPL